MDKKLFNEILVSYDMGDNKLRAKLANELKDLGLIHIQKSVMWGFLLPAEERNITAIFKKYCKQVDKAFYTRIKLADYIEYNGVGYSTEIFEQLRRYEIY
jgi:CRISPR-associated protein Cas2